jgi:hypothetical protein
MATRSTSTVTITITIPHSDFRLLVRSARNYRRWCVEQLVGNLIQDEILAARSYDEWLAGHRDAGGEDRPGIGKRH